MKSVFSLPKFEIIETQIQNPGKERANFMTNKADIEGIAWCPQ